ncbi:DUF393 domain-containing protein [Calidifontibacter sp. DB0510]|uniref:DUF393 domain-containing protein n=1 Tax=Metallococcus carri TaxID=1656884 RepID=A0A967B048_9MICO|nr:DCC1-like thiol-disulfide oxidoreductase family protein [Metallococcus carri]NHN55569.1 DUF393 domain-containing protein [Metallococcus carri]NOP38247.1 DUF393 domain-containing protein [Calidifontibacter sp. DB2511S]
MIDAVLIFDGDCGFCTRTARFADRFVSAGRYQVAAWQELDLPAFGLTPQECTEAAQFVDDQGRVSAGHRAIAAGLTHGRAVWRPLGHLIVTPGIEALSARAYAWVAAHRYQLPGGTPQCAMPNAS